MLLIALILLFCSLGIIVYFGVPKATGALFEFNQRRAQKFSSQMDRTMMVEDLRLVKIFYIIGPFVLAPVGFFVLPNNPLIGVLAGAAVGFVIPRTIANFYIGKRRAQFNTQLVDALIIMSSSFRGGLSLVQSMEAIIDEMPNPICQEMGIVIGENKIGVSMDEALQRLYKRMPSPALQQVITAILLARETGGNLPVIFSRIVHTIREKRKLEENIMVLTVQGKLQALVMSGLPVGFFLMVSSTNPNYFKVMLNTEIGRTLLIFCVVAWVVGTFMIIKISSFKDF